MSLPSIDGQQGTYLFKWEQESIQARVDRFVDHSERTSAEVLIRHTLFQPSHIYQGRLNLVSLPARRSWAKELETRVPLNWYEIMEQLCTLSLDRWREGEPILQLKATQPKEALQYRVKPLLLDRHPTIFHGRGGTAKSLVMQYLAVLMDLPLDAASFEVEPANVLYLDYEADCDAVDERLRLVRLGLGYSTEANVLYRFCAQPLAHEIEAIQRAVVEYEVSYVIVDSLNGAVGNNLREDQWITQFFNAVRSLRIGAGIVHHNNKEGELYGNEFIWNRARSVWAVKRSGEPGDKSFDIGLIHKKMNDGPLQRPIALHVDWTAGFPVFSKVDPAKVEATADSLGARERIVSLLKRGALPSKTLAEELDMKEETVRQVVHRAPHLFQRLPGGVLGLASSPDGLPFQAIVTDRGIIT